MNTQQLDHTYIANTYARYPVTIVRGKGSLVWDENGNLVTGIHLVFDVPISACRKFCAP